MKNDWQKTDNPDMQLQPCHENSQGVVRQGKFLAFKTSLQTPDFPLPRLLLDQLRKKKKPGKKPGKRKTSASAV